MKQYGDCDPVDNKNQDPNNYYVSPKIQWLEIYLSRYFPMVSLATVPVPKARVARDTIGK